MFKAIRQGFAIIDPKARPQLAGIVLLILLNALFEMFGVSMVFPFIKLANDPAILSDYQIAANLYAFLGFSEPRWFIIVAGLGFLGLIMVKNLLSYLVNSIQTRFSFKQAVNSGIELFRRYLDAPYPLHLQRNSSSLINGVNSLVDTVYGYVVLPFITLVTEVVVLVGVLSVLVWSEPMITLVTMACLGACFGVMLLSVRDRLVRYGKAHMELNELRLKCLQQALSSVKEVKILGRESYFRNQFGDLRGRHADVQWRIGNLSQIPRLAVETLAVAAVVGVVVLVLINNRQMADITPILALFAVAAFRMIPSVNRLILALGNIRMGMPVVQGIHDDFMAGTLAERSRAATMVEPARFEDAMTVSGVTYCYPETDKPVLHNVSLSVKRGESIGFVGPSGAGKSTLIDIILGLLTPQVGQLLVDGHDVTADPRPWQRLIGYVPQAVVISDESLRRNVAFAVPDAEIDDAQVWRALEMAHLGEFTHALPLGLDTELGERGVRLSGGQRQRIAIARALYHDPEVLVMDEATAALDSATEREVTVAVEGLHGRKTLLIIAHRLSTVRHCDRVVVMKDGILIGNAPFDRLAEECEEFRHMVQLAELVSAAPDDLNALH